MRTVAFRTDATAKVALGHLRRCIALAHALRREGAEAQFRCFDDPAARAMLEGGGFRCHWLAREINAPGDAADTVEHLRRQPPAVLVVDSYAADDAYFHTLRGAGVPLAYFDDGDPGWLDCPVECVINGLADAEALPYRAPVSLLGTRHLVLGQDYWDAISAAPGEPVREILVTMGGIDHYDLSSRVIRLCARIARGSCIHIVIGPYYENRANIETAAREVQERVVLHQAPRTLQPLMARADLAISAGGFTLYELAATGVPTIGIALWENQRRNVETLARQNTIVPLHYDDGERFDDRLAAAIRGLMEDPGRRFRLARSGQQLVDGKGALHTARAILALIKCSVEIGHKQ